MTSKPYSSACERNQPFILAQLQSILKPGFSVLEIGSGTGQHAVFFGHALPHVHWQTSDVSSMHAGIKMWLEELQLTNVHAPLNLDIAKDTIPLTYDAIYTANTFHIMPWETVEICIDKVAGSLKPNGLFIIYGPFKFKGSFTSESNVEFDEHLKAVALHQGIRDFEAIEKYAEKVKLKHLKTIAMPANNFMLLFRKHDAANSIGM
jgi:cyclopropane fatty-acyl-phospholipid synthase-like methyltransferase